jgi:VanZ family protein
MQRGIPGRVPDERDLLANTLGGIAGVVVAMVLTLPGTLRRRRRKRQARAMQWGQA